MINEQLIENSEAMVKALRDASELHQLDLDPSGFVAAADRIERLLGSYQGKCKVEDKLEQRISELEAHIEQLEDLLTAFVEDSDEVMDFLRISGGRNHLIMADDIEKRCKEFEELPTLGVKGDKT